MTLEEIGKRVGYEPNTQQTVKQATRLWLASMYQDFPIALTLTLKQTIVEDTAQGTVRHSITKQDCERIAQQFQRKLNRAVFGKRAADKFGKSLRYIPIVEGERTVPGKNSRGLTPFQYSSTAS